MVQLTSVLYTFKTIIEEKTREIEQHNTLFEKAKTTLQLSTSADEIQNFLDQVHATIAENQKSKISEQKLDVELFFSLL